MTRKVSVTSRIDRDIKKSIICFFKDMQNILLVFLFGSYASKQMSVGSDIDIAVLFDRTQSIYEINDLKDRLSEILKKDVDLVALNEASPVIKMQVLKKGDLLIMRHKNDFSTFYGDTVNQYDDLKITRKQCEDNILKGRIYA